MCITQLSSMYRPPFTNPERLAILERKMEMDDNNINILRYHLDTTIESIAIMFREVYDRLRALETGVVPSAHIHDNPIVLHLPPGLNPIGVNRTNNGNPDTH